MEKAEDREWLVLENQGFKIFGMMHHPRDVSNYPAVLVCHGFGGNKCGKHRVYVGLAEALARRGIATLRMDFRGAGDSEGNFRDVTLSGEVSDALVGLDYLLNHADVDASRIGILGRSLGGVIAVMVASSFGQAQGIALWSPVFDAIQWQQLWNQHKSQSIGPIGEELIVFEGRPTTTTFIQEFFKMQLEPELKNLQNIPFLHYHGDKDNTVTVAYHAAEYERCRQGSEGESVFRRLPNSDHDLSDLDERRRLIEETAEWFQETLR